MFTKDVRFEGWTTDDWSRLLALWAKEPSETDREDAGGGLLVLHSAGRVRKVLHTRKGRIEREGISWPAPLAVLAAEHAASWIIAAQVGGLEQIAERFGARCRGEDDLIDQARRMLDVLRELLSEGVIEIWPHRVELFSLPTRSPFEHTLRALFPPGHLITLAVFHEGELWTGVTVAREEGGISRVVGPEEIRRALSFLSGDFRRDYRFALDAIERTLGPVAFGCFTELSIFRALQRQTSWAAWARALIVRDVIVTPISTSLAVPMAADGAAWASIALGALAKRSDTLDLMLSLWRRWR